MTASRDRWLCRQNRRLRWTKGNYTLNRCAPHPAHHKIRRDVVRMLLRTRQWRLAITVAAMPVGYALSKQEPKHEPDCVLASRGHEGPCVDEPPHLYDPRPNPREFPDYWME